MTISLMAWLLKLLHSIEELSLIQLFQSMMKFVNNWNNSSQIVKEIKL